MTSTRASIVAIFGLAAVHLGCGQSRASDDAGTTADAVRLDAFVEADALTPPDAPSDRDGDGVVDGLDCAPDDPSASTSALRACSSACAMGTETCADGAWSACDATNDCACATPGMRRVISCGQCGSISQECRGSMWTDVSACLGEGPCRPGSVETRMLPMCQVDQRLCDATCMWGAWSTVTPAGECEPGSEYCDRTGTLMGLDGDHVCTPECRRIDNPCCPPPGDPGMCS